MGGKRKSMELGDVVQIELESGEFAYARVLMHPLVAFYETGSHACCPVGDVVRKRIAFKIWIMDSAFRKKNWKIIGNAPLGAELLESPLFFKQDSVTKELSLYREGKESKATLDQCLSLERASVWSAVHIESRLLDAIHGRPNKWVEMGKPKVSSD